MSPGALVSLANLAVLPGWALLVLFPRWRHTRLFAAYVIPGGLCVVYLAVMLLHAGGVRGEGFGSIDQLSRLFENPWLLTATWLHYLAFDLFIGAWEVRDSLRLGIPHWYVVPCLVLTFVVGPVGLVVYFVIRALLVRRWPGTDPTRPYPTHPVPKDAASTRPVAR